MKKDNHKASVLAVALIILGVIVVIAISVSSVAIQERKGSIGASQSTVALQNADSGIETVLQKIKNSAGTIADVDTDGICDGIYDPGDGYAVELRDISENLVTGCATTVSEIKKVKSTGSSGQGSRAIEVGMSCPSVISSDSDTVGWWRFGESSGNQVADFSSSSPPNDGTAINATITSGACNARQFNGTSAYIDFSNPASLQLSTGTVEALIMTGGAGTSYRGIVVKQGAYGIFLMDNVLVIYDWGAAAYRSTGINLADGNWHYIAFSFQSGINNGTIIYVDGQSRLTTTMAVSTQSNGLSAGAGNNPGSAQFFTGIIDEIRISNTARSPEYIQNSYNSLKSGYPELGLP